MRCSVLALCIAYPQIQWANGTVHQALQALTLVLNNDWVVRNEIVPNFPQDNDACLKALQSKYPASAYDLEKYFR